MGDEIKIPEYYICNFCGEKIKAGIINLINHQHECKGNEVVEMSEGVTAIYSHSIFDMIKPKTK